MSEPFKSLEGALFVLPSGPNTINYYLGCHMLGDVSWPRGDNTQMFCPDPSGPNRYKQVGKIKGPPGLVSLSVETDIYSAADYLEDLQCPAGLIVNMTKSSRKNRVTNWERAFIFPGFDVTNENLSNLVGKDTNDRSMRSVDANADEIIYAFPLNVYRQSTSQTTAINKIFSCDEFICQSEFATAHDRCDKLFATTDAIAGSALGSANVLYKSGDGAWTAMTNDPFGTDEHILAGLCVPVDNDTTRVLVFRGVTDGSNPAEVAYTDNDGATAWVTANIGAVNGEFVGSANAAYAIDYNHIWVGTDGGYIYFSSDGGATWTAQESASIHSGQWNWIQFIDENTGFAGGAADVIAVTTDGGSTWSQVTATGDGDDILTGWVFNARQLWIGTDGGDIWYSNDQGTTWTKQTNASFTGTGTVEAMAWANQWVGVVAWESASNLTTYYYTKDGGYTWESITTPTNGGVNSLLVCSTKLFFGAGEVQGSTGVIHRLAPSS